MYELKQFMAQCLMGDRRPICKYEDQGHVPFVIRKRLTSAEVAPFLDIDSGPVTFAGQVPLDVVVHGFDAIDAYIVDNWFESAVEMQSPEFRAIGAAFEDFSQQFSGLVHLQVTCALVSI